MAQQFTNLAQSTLASAYTAGDATILLANAAQFPSTGNFTLAMGYPTQFYIQCTAVSGNILTVSTSGQEGTNAVNLAIGTTVTQVITAGVLNSFRQEFPSLGIGPFSSLPTTGMKLGDQYKSNDSGLDSIYNGSAWEHYWGGTKITTVCNLTGATTTLNGSILSGANSCTVASSVGFSAPCVVQMESENILVTAIVGTTWTITRAYDGTSAAGHASSVVVTLLNWQSPAALATSNVTTSYTGGMLMAYCTSGTGQMFMKNVLPYTTNYTAEIRLVGTITGSNVSWGMFARDPVAGKRFIIFFYNNVFYQQTCTDGGSISLNQSIANYMCSEDVAYRLVDDGVNLKFYISHGQSIMMPNTWTIAYSVARGSAYCIPTEFGFFFQPSGNWGNILCPHYKVTTP